MRTEYPDGSVEVIPKNERMLRIGMNEYRIERYYLNHHYERGYGYCTWYAWVVTTYGAFCIYEGRNYDYVLKKMNEFIEAA